MRDLILDCLDPGPKARPTALQLVERLQATPAAPPAPQSPLRNAGVGGRGPPARPPPAASQRGRASAPGHSALPQTVPKAVSSPSPAITPRAFAAPALTTVDDPPTAGGSISFPDEPAPASPFAAAAAAGPGAAASPHQTQHAQQAEHEQQAKHREEAEAPPHGLARPPRPPTPLGRSASSGRLRHDSSQHHCQRGASAASRPSLHVQLSPAMPEAEPVKTSNLGFRGSSAATAASSLHKCPLFPVLSQQLRRQQSSPAVLEGVEEEPSLGWQLGGGSAAGGLQLGEVAALPALAGSTLLLGHCAARPSARHMTQHRHHLNMPHQSSAPALAGMLSAESAPVQGVWQPGPAPALAGQGSPAHHPWALPAEQQGAAAPSQQLMGVGEALGLPGAISADALDTLTIPGTAQVRTGPAAQLSEAAVGPTSPDNGDVWGRLLFNN